MAQCDYIISNPPYSLKFEVFKKLFEIGKPFAMLVGVVGLFESTKRFNLFKENKFEIMYFDKRISYFKSYTDQKTSLNPPFSSVYICKDLLPKQIVFEALAKKYLIMVKLAEITIRSYTLRHLLYYVLACRFNATQRLRV